MDINTSRFIQIMFPKWRTAIFTLALLCCMGAVAPFWVAAATTPAIRYASTDKGPSTGWPGDNSKGAAITIWAENIGDARKDSTLTVCGITLNKDTDFAEWGTNQNPKTAKNTRRITFWLTPAMSGSAGIHVTVNGVQSNTIPFSITATGNLYVYPDHKSAQDWEDLDDAAESMTPGDFLYLRGRLDEYDQLTNGQVRIGWWQTTLYGGTNEHRITVTSYPGEEAVLNFGIWAFSPFWNFARLSFEGTSSKFVYSGLLLGDSNIWRSTYPHSVVAQGYRAVGNEFRGTMGHASNMYGDDIHFEGNFIKFIPHPDIRNDSAYSLYLYSGLNRVIKDNEIHGGSKWLLHYYDERRKDETYKEISGIIEGNWLDATNNGGVGLRGALIFDFTSSACDFNVLRMEIKNNVFIADNQLTAGFGMALFRHDVKNVKFYNNLFYNINTIAYNIYSLYEDGAESTMEIKNNIFFRTAVDIDASYSIDPGLDISNNLYDDGPDLTGEANDTLSFSGDPGWIAPGTDFRLQTGSLAIDNGLALAEVDMDYHHTPRFQMVGYDIGPFEYYEDPSSVPGDGSSDGENETGKDSGCLISTTIP